MVDKRLLRLSQSGDPEANFGTVRSQLAARGSRASAMDRMRVNNRNKETFAGNTPHKSPLPGASRFVFDQAKLDDDDCLMSLEDLLAQSKKEAEAAANASKDDGEAGWGGNKQW